MYNLANIESKIQQSGMNESKSQLIRWYTMTRGNHFRLMMLLVLVSGILIIPAMATTLDIEGATFAAVGEEREVEITLAGATNGPGGYILQLEVEDPTIAEIVSVEFRSWATLNGTSSLPSTEPVLTAADLLNTDYDTWGRIANVTVKAKKPGTTNLTVNETYANYKILYDDGAPVNPTVNKGLLTVAAPPDTTPPGSITNLANTTQQTSIIWTWTDPVDPDFEKVMVYLDGVFKVNVSKGIQSYLADSLAPSSQHEIATRTVDQTGNVNLTWVNQTATTNALPDTTPPGSITNLTNTTQQTSITWNWDNPADLDFAKVMVYFDNVWVENVTATTKTFSALSPGTQHTIGTRTVDNSGNVNATWVNQTATTQTSGATGSLWISTSPRYATVSIDDVQQPGLTPNSYTAAAGNRKVTMTYGALTKTIFVDVPANGQVRLNVIL
jgi:hypothetical protein